MRRDNSGTAKNGSNKGQLDLTDFFPNIKKFSIKCTFGFYEVIIALAVSLTAVQEKEN